MHEAKRDEVPLPEPDAWRIRYRSEPGMLGHYPWSYEERKRSAVGRTEFDVEPIYAADKTREYGRQCVEQERERCAKLVEQFPHWLGNEVRAEIAAAIRKDTP